MRSTILVAVALAREEVATVVHRKVWNEAPRVQQYCGAAIDGVLYVFGGSSMAGRLTNDVWKWEPDHAWKLLEPLPINVASCATAVDDQKGEVYVMGGLTTGLGEMKRNATDAAFVFRTREEEEEEEEGEMWGALPKLPSEVAGAAAAVLDGFVHVVGGASSNGQDIFAREESDLVVDVASHWVLDASDPDAGWVGKKRLTVGRNHLALVAFDGKLYAVGGQFLQADACTSHTTLEVYDPATDKWAFGAPMPHGRTQVGGSAFGIPGIGIAVWGGTGDSPGACERGSSRAFDYGLVYEPESRTWHRVSGLNLGAAVCGLSRSNVLLCYSDGEIVHATAKWTTESSVLSQQEIFEERVTHSPAALALRDELVRQWELVFRDYQTTCNVTGICAAFSDARKVLTSAQIMRILQWFDLRRSRPKLTFKDSYDYTWWLWHYFGSCSLRLATEDEAMASLLSIRRDMIDFYSIHAPNFADWVKIIDRNISSSRNICVFHRREAIVSFVHGFVWDYVAARARESPKDIGLFWRSAGAICDGPALGDDPHLHIECHHAIGHSSVIVAATQLGKVPDASLVFRAGAFNVVFEKNQIGDLYSRIVQICMSGECTGGDKHSWALLVDYEDDDVWWYAHGIHTKPWQATQPIEEPCDDYSNILFDEPQF
ncbi:hypothetical protein CTAYLR_003256 [Chrysophaeum taylorii]|uniref:Uncharacterized protein n=1 Tax=Chrysophaeum taylorii TaxID=2483200 RepID=A0AAD7UAY7_9STRA|nr:hypothetical protein CTAYLR_003256 [Chrysophaeum taylorii]